MDGRLTEDNFDDSGHPDVKNQYGQREGSNEDQYDGGVGDEFVSGWPNNLAYLSHDLAKEERNSCEQVLLLSRRVAAFGGRG